MPNIVGVGNHINVCILGAGISGLSTSYHIGHQHCEIFEKEEKIGGLLQCENKNNFIWDKGPHVSFTKNEYVKNLFADNVDFEYDEFEVSIENYYKGIWIPHPAQLNFHAIPSPLKERCLSSFIDSQKNKTNEFDNYEQWLENSFGAVFARNFPMEYTKKYWTVEAKYLDIDWLGIRLRPPLLSEVTRGLDRVSEKNAHYIQYVRYPKRGGYYSFIKKIAKNANVRTGRQISLIDLQKKEIHISNGEIYSYDTLISTIPLPSFVGLILAPKKVQTAASQLSCTSVLLVNICATKILKEAVDWFYVYDEKYFSTRVSILRKNQDIFFENGMHAIQVEVYFSKYKTPNKTFDEISKIVASELVEMGLIEDVQSFFWRLIPYANVIFDKSRKASQNLILNWLEELGLVRESDDLQPMTSWGEKSLNKMGDLIFAGRFAQWKYYWTDDCVLRSKHIAESLKSFGKL